MKPVVEILMATYNGADYVRQQINSIQSQTLSDWKLNICDDRSTDGTLDIITSIAREDPRINIISQDIKFGSAQANFTYLMSQASGDYVFLADQDDIWHPNKLKLFMDRMHEAERRYSADTPLLAFSDLTVVDVENHVIAPSFLTYIGRDPHRTSLNELLVQNLVTGCASAMNQAMVQVVQSFSVSDSKAMMMHDWVYALLAASVGHLIYVDEATVDYRQHGTNVMGAHPYSSCKTLLGLIIPSSRRKQDRITRLRQTIEQAKLVRASVQSRALSPARSTLDAYCDIPSQTRMQRIHTLFTYGFWPNKIADRIRHLLAALSL